MIKELKVVIDTEKYELSIFSDDGLAEDFNMQRKIATAMMARVVKADAPADIREYMSVLNAEIALQTMNLFQN